jgi:hypothetical protein
MVELYLHSLTHLFGVVLDELSRETALICGLVKRVFSNIANMFVKISRYISPNCVEVQDAGLAV